MDKEDITVEECEQIERDILHGAVMMVDILHEAHKDPEDYCLAVNNFTASLMVNVVSRAGGVDLEAMTESEKGAIKGGVTMIYRIIMASLDKIITRDKSQEH